ncbi:MAG TPA: metallophosphoesterase [Gemmatimonadales bacterium]|nr:metallophosphoesterase [Gemmatimonadales bacterium]
MSDPQGSSYRDPEHLLGVPRALGPSHRLTQDELYRQAARPGRFNRAVDYLKIKWVLWLWHYLKTRIGGRYPFADYDATSADRGIYPLAGDRVRIAIVGDWGTGTREAHDVATAMVQAEPHFTIHLGDVYYVGTKQEMYDNMLGRRVAWPVGSVGSFALNANHEMYARGKGYFKYLLPKLGVGGAGQRASFFCLRNDHWLVIGLDTGYYSVGLPLLERIFKPNCRLHDKLVKWLREDVKLQDDRTRGVILLSHHQYHSQFEAIHDTAARQLSELVHRPVLWFWGHEHRFAIYRKHATKHGKLEAYGRCIGHGGLPIEDIDEEPKTDARHRVGLVLYDRRRRAELGPQRTKVGWNGFAVLEFQGSALTVDYRDARNRLLVRERWQVGAGGVIRGVSIEKVTDDRDLKLHSASLEDAL